MIVIFFVVEIMDGNYAQGMLLSRLAAASVHSRLVSLKRYIIDTLLLVHS